jgi:hypothetical protein
MSLPTSDAGRTYLSQSEPILSEPAAAGLVLQPEAPTIGDQSRYYAGEVSAGDAKLVMHNVLFRVGPIVAKVFVGGFGTTEADVLGRYIGRVAVWGLPAV